MQFSRYNQEGKFASGRNELWQNQSDCIFVIEIPVALYYLFENTNTVEDFYTKPMLNKSRTIFQGYHVLF